MHTLLWLVYNMKIETFRVRIIFHEIFYGKPHWFTVFANNSLRCQLDDLSWISRIISLITIFFWRFWIFQFLVRIDHNLLYDRSSSFPWCISFRSIRILQKLNWKDVSGTFMTSRVLDHSTRIVIK